MVSLDISKRSIGLDSVNVSFLRDEGTQAGKKPFPLVITPRWESSLSFLTTWMEANRAWLDERLLQYGAVLIRGFEIDSGADMQKAMRSFQPKLNNTYRGTSPRNLIPGTEYIFSAGMLRNLLAKLSVLSVAGSPSRRQFSSEVFSVQFFLRSRYCGFLSPLQPKFPSTTRLPSTWKCLFCRHHQNNSFSVVCNHPNRPGVRLP